MEVGLGGLGFEAGRVKGLGRDGVDLLEGLDLGMVVVV